MTVHPDKVEDLLWLTSNGVPAQEAITRVGWTPDAAYAWARRHRHTDLLNAVRPAYTHHDRQRQRERAR